MGLFASKPVEQHHIKPPTPRSTIASSIVDEAIVDEEPSWAIAFKKQDDWCDCQSWESNGASYRDSSSCHSTCSQSREAHWHCVSCGKNTSSPL